MIYNLYQYLVDEFPDETIYVNARMPQQGTSVIPDRNILIQESGGNVQPVTEFTEKSFQLLARDATIPGARELAWLFFEELSSRFGLILPLVSVGGIVYNEIQSAAIMPIQEPYFIGNDEEGRAEFTTNYIVRYTRE